MRFRAIAGQVRRPSSCSNSIDIWTGLQMSKIFNSPGRNLFLSTVDDSTYLSYGDYHTTRVSVRKKNT